MKRLSWRMCLGFLAGVGAAPGCGEPFATSGGTGGSSSSSASASGSATGSTASSTGTGGTGACTPGVLNSCPGNGVYCAATLPTPTCMACSDTSRFTFGKAGTLPVSPNTLSAAYPRVATDSGDLYFTEEQTKTPTPRYAVVSATLTPKTTQWQPWAAELTPINVDANSIGALYIVDSSGLSNIVETSKVQTGASKPVLLWDSDRDSGRREIFAINPGGTQTSLLQLNTTGSRDSRIAMAPGASSPRLWWMSDTGAVTMDRLVTAPTDKSTPAAAVPLVLENGCHGASVDNPWVTPDGTLLLFDAVRPDLAACGLSTTMVHHLYASKVGPDGQQTAGAKASPLLPGDPATYDVTPSLSPDMCYLLFARVDTGANGTLSIAARE